MNYFIIQTHSRIAFLPYFLPRKKAEGRGFEPLIPLQVYRISSAAHSASLATLRFLTGRVRRLRPLGHSSALYRTQAIHWLHYLYCISSVFFFSGAVSNHSCFTELFLCRQVSRLFYFLISELFGGSSNAFYFRFFLSIWPEKF